MFGHFSENFCSFSRFVLAIASETKMIIAIDHIVQALRTLHEHILLTWQGCMIDKSVGRRGGQG